MIMAPAAALDWQPLKRRDYGGLASQFQSEEKINLEAVGQPKQSCCRFSSPAPVNTDGGASTSGGGPPHTGGGSSVQPPP